MFVQSQKRHFVLQAVLMAVMLTGSQCARVMTSKAKSANAHENLAHSLLADGMSPSSGSSEIHSRSGLVTWQAKWGGGSEVCRQKDLSSNSSVNRYRYKVQKLKALATRVEEKACGMSCPQKWLELKSRMQHFMSCAELLKGGDETNVPRALQETMSSGEDSLLAMQRSTMDALAVILEQYDFFPKFDNLGACRFKPSDLDFEKASASSNPEGAIHEQLFGPGCSNEAAKEYMARLKGNPQRIAATVMETAKQVLALTRHNDNATQSKETEDVIAKLTTMVEGHEASANKEADSLMSSGALLEVADLSSPKLSDLIEDLAKDSARSLDVSSGAFAKFLKFLGAFILIVVALMCLYFVALVWIFSVVMTATPMR